MASTPPSLKCRPVSDLLQAAAAALETPADLVQRSAAARAEASGSTVDEVLAAWAGGAPVSSPAAVTPAAAVAETPVEAEAVPTAVAVSQEALVITAAPAPEPLYQAEPAEPLDPAALGDRLRISMRIGAWTGAALGVVAVLIASAFWAANTLLDPDAGPVVAVDSQGLVLGVALVSIVFGAFVAAFSRAGTSWVNPAMQLSSSKMSTVWVGAALGLLAGIVGGLGLSGLGTAIEGSEGLVQIPVLGAIALMILGGAGVGAVTAGAPQLVGTPVAVPKEDEPEVNAVRKRLGDAVSIPLAGLALLLLLVLPFAYALIESNHMTTGGASLIGILTAGGILGFAALSGTRPQMKISFGELMVALAGIGTVLVIIIAVLFFRSLDDHSESDEHTSVIELTI